jgi:broad specificity phosphatase PhoE
VTAGRWAAQAPELQAWRRRVVEALGAIREPSVVVSHYIAINVAVGGATGDDRVVSFAPDHCSVTLVEVEDGALRLIERGAEAATRVL